MSYYTTLQYGANEKKFEDWGIDLNTATCQTVNMGVDKYRFSIPVTSVTSHTYAFPVGAKVTIRRLRISAAGVQNTFSGGEVAFQGWRLDPGHDYGASATSVSYEFGNAWYFAETCVFQQPVASFIQGVTVPGQPGTFDYPHVSDVLLFTKVVTIGQTRTIAAITNGEQVYEALTFLQDSMEALYTYNPTTYADYHNAFFLDVDVANISQQIPSYSVREITVASVVQKCLEMASDATVACDYSTVDVNGRPTFRVKRRAQRTAVNARLADSVDSVSARVSPRTTIKPISVVVNFRYIGSDQGVEWVSNTKTVWPVGAPERGPGVVIQTFDMRGTSTNSLTATVRVEAMDANAPGLTGADYPAWAAGGQERRKWWESKAPQLADRSERFQRKSTDTQGLTAVVRVGVPRSVFSYDNKQWQTGEQLNTDYPGVVNMIADGSSVPAWAGITVLPVTVETFEEAHRIKYDRPAVGTDPDADVTGLHEDYPIGDMSTRIMMTNAVVGTHTYSTTTVSVPAESYPLNLARQIYESLSELQYEGEDVRVKVISDAPGIVRTVTVNNSLNIVGPTGVALGGDQAAWATMRAVVQSVTEQEGTGQVTVTFGPAKHLSAADLMSVFRFNRARFNTESQLTRAGAVPGSSGGVQI